MDRLKGGKLKIISLPTYNCISVLRTAVNSLEIVIYRDILSTSELRKYRFLTTKYHYIGDSGITFLER